MSDSYGQETIPTLHHLSSSTSFRVLWALEEVSMAQGLKYNLKLYPRVKGLAPPELKNHFPLGKSPIMTVEPTNGGEAEVYQFQKGTLTETRSILQFISDHYSKGIWVPESEEDKRRDIFLQEFANSTLLQKVDFALVFEAIPPQLPFPFRQIIGLLVKPVVNHWINDLQAPYRLLEDFLSENKPWFGGEKLGLADFNMIFPIDIAVQRGYLDTKKYPKIKKWHEAVKQRPAYRSALERGGAYDLVKWK